MYNSDKKRKKLNFFYKINRRFCVKLVLLQESGASKYYSLSIYLNKDNYDAQIQEAIRVIDDAISKGNQIAYVSFYDSSFSGVKKEKLLTLFEAIKKANVNNLSLAAVNLTRITVAETQGLLDLTIDLCNAGGIEKIDLSKNCIGSTPLEQQRIIVEKILAIVPYIKEIDLSFNNLETLEVDLSGKLVVSCAQSLTLDVIKLDYNHLVLIEETDGMEYDINLRLLSSLFLKAREEHKWKFLSIASTDLGFLAHKDWNVLLKNIEQCCESINLSHNSLQAYTKEGLLEVYEEQDLIQIIAEWLEGTKLKIVDLTHNNFSDRNTTLLEGAIKGREFAIETGNRSPNDSNYEKLLKLSKLEEENFDKAQPQLALSSFYMHSTTITPYYPLQEDIIQINAVDVEEEVAIFMQNLAKKNPAILHAISKEDLLTVINSVLTSHNIRVIPTCSLNTLSNNSDTIKTSNKI